MNICMITFQYPPILGGVASATQRLAKNLVSHGFQVNVVTPGLLRAGATITPSVEDGVIVHRTFSALNRYFTRGWQDSEELQTIGEYVKRLHQEESFDIIHGLFLIPAGLIGAIVAKEIDRPFIASIRGSDVGLIRFDANLFNTMRWVLEQADLVTSVNTELLAQARQVADIRVGRSIPNAYDPSQFEDKPLQEFVLTSKRPIKRVTKKLLRIKNKNQFVIGTSGAIRFIKGYAFLIEAFEKFRYVFPESHLLIVGKYHRLEEKIHARRLMRKLRLKRYITITGQVPHSQVLSWLREMDVFAFPSLQEGSPNALLEAMAGGVPVVGSGIGGITDLITDGIEGLLVPPCDADTLAEALIRLAKDSRLRENLAAAAKHKIEIQYSPKKEIETWIDIYKNLLCGVPPL